jgi:hypothetical protein
MSISTWTFTRYFLALGTVAACSTPTIPSQSCDALLGTMQAALVKDGYKLAQTQGSPAGTMAGFVNAATAKARILYVAPAAAIADYLAASGWTAAGSCAGPKDVTYYILQQDIEVPMTAGKGGPT